MFEGGHSSGSEEGSPQPVLLPALGKEENSGGPSPHVASKAKKPKDRCSPSAQC